MLKAAVFCSRPTVGSSVSGAASTSQASARRDCRLASFPQNVGRHRAVRYGRKPRPVEARKQRSGVAVADIGLVPGGFRQPADHCLRDPARAIAAAGAPDRVVGLVVGNLEEGLRPRRIVTGKMPVRSRGTADGNRSPVSRPGKALRRASALCRQHPQTAGSPARSRRSCAFYWSCERPVSFAPDRQRP